MADPPHTIRSQLWLKCFCTCTPTHCTQGSPAFSEPTKRARAGISVNLLKNILYQQNQHLSALKCQLWNVPRETMPQIWKNTHYQAIWSQAGGTTTQLLVQWTTWLLRRVSVHFLRKSKFFIIHTVLHWKYVPKDRIFWIYICTKKPNQTKTNKKHTGYAIDVTFYKMTVFVKGTRFPEGSGLTFLSLFFSSQILQWKRDSLKPCHVTVSRFFYLDKWSALWHNLVREVTNST